MRNNDFDAQTALTVTARIEQTHELHGSSVKNTGKKYSIYRNGKVYLGEEEVEVSAWSFASPFVYKFAIRLDEQPLYWDQVQNLDPAIRMTKGLVMIKYTPRGSKDYKKGRPFKIGQDLIRWDIRVSGPKEWEQLARRIPELKWLQRNSTLTRRMFDLAGKHPGMTFWCNVNWEKYADKLQAKSDVYLSSPFLCHKTSVRDYKEIFKSQDKTLKIRCFNDIISDVNKVERLPSVQKEMRDMAGETYIRDYLDIGRSKTTGRFLKRKQEEE